MRCDCAGRVQCLGLEQEEPSRDAAQTAAINFKLSLVYLEPWEKIRIADVSLLHTRKRDSSLGKLFFSFCMYCYISLYFWVHVGATVQIQENSSWTGMIPTERKIVCLEPICVQQVLQKAAYSLAFKGFFSKFAIFALFPCKCPGCK